MRSVFVDTNVLIYARDPAFPTKARQAQTWLSALAAKDEAVLSPQIINEFVAVSLRRFRVPLQEIHARACDLVSWCHASTDSATTLLAMRVQSEYRTSWWDALVVSSALGAGCRYILSEDMQPGMVFHDLTVVDPFASDPEAILSKS
jgi:predicted nucleic acid-binding protein